MLIVKNRTSPKKPLIAALLVACISVPYCLGYRGKFRLSAESLDFASSARVFLFVTGASFIVFYPLRILGVLFDREDREDARSEDHEENK